MSPWHTGAMDLARILDSDSRSITAENPTGERGAGGRATLGTGAIAARNLGVGWKVSPSCMVAAGEERELARIEGPGVIQHLWLTTDVKAWRSLVLRMHWDDEGDFPGVATPLGDFFCQGWAAYAPLTSELVVVAPFGGLNCYLPMPFRKKARVTIENLSEQDHVLYYQFDYTLREIPDDVGYLHTSWRRSNPVPRGSVHTILDSAIGRGSYVGTYMAVGVNSPGWWGEGEVKVFIDEDEEFPTICGAGTEDYFGGAWDFDVPGSGYTTFTSNYLGFHQVLRPDGLYRSQTRFGMYRWHVPDPIAFQKKLTVTVQDLGWHRDHTYKLRSDDIASVAFWYSDDPSGLPSDMTLYSLEV